MTALNTLVSEAIDVVVHCARRPGGPVVTEVLAVEDLAGGAGATQFTVTDVFDRSVDGTLEWTGHVPARLSTHFARSGIDLPELLGIGAPGTRT